MNILVIGNGFDLAHGFKTSYGNYLNYVDDFNFFYQEKCVNHNHTPDISQVKDNDNIKYFINLFNGFGTDKTSREIIDEQNKLIGNNVWIPYFRNRQAEMSDKWVDFEGEISRVIQLLDEVRHIVLAEGKKRDFKRMPVNRYLNNSLHMFRVDGEDRWSPKDIADVKKLMLTDLNRLTRSYELYITSFVKEQDINKRIPIIEKLNIDRVLSFNYSDTYEKWYGIGRSGIEYDYIHGKAGVGKNVDTCNMVLGIDEYLDEPAKANDNEFIEFKKFYQRIYKQTGSKYMSWLANLNTHIDNTRKTTLPVSNVYFYGHSLDITDGDIIAKLIQIENATTTIYYHQKKALRDQIANLVKILGEEELIERTGDYKPSIIFKPCNEE